MTIVLVLLLAAAPPVDKTKQCQASFSALDASTGLKTKLIAELAKKYPDAEANVTKRFVDACKALPDTDIDCPLLKKGEDVRACKGAMGALQTAISGFMEEKDPGAFERFERKSMQVEAKATLKGLSTSLRALHAEEPTKFKLTPVGPTPAEDCCKRPEKACLMDDKAWQQGFWSTLAFAPPATKLRYHYEILPMAKDGTIVIRASGDPQCNGKKDVWEARGRLVGDTLTMEDPINLTAEPPAPAAKGPAGPSPK